VTPCGKCRFAVRVTSDGPANICLATQRFTWLECHHGPPIVDPGSSDRDGFWPSVKETDCCGKGEPREQEPQT
jgi:hypothetical protein